MKMKFKVFGIVFTFLLMLGVVTTTTSAKPIAKLNKSKVTLYVGSKDTLQLKNAKKVSWKSSDPQIAIVSSKGKILAKREGNCIITATDRQTNKKYVCKVVVPIKTIPVALDAKIPWNASKGFKVISKKEIRQYILCIYGDKISTDAIFQPEDDTIVRASSPDTSAPLWVYKTGSTLLNVTSNGKLYTYQLDVLDALWTYDDFNLSNISPGTDEAEYAVGGKLNAYDILTQYPKCGHISGGTNEHNPEMTTARNIKMGSSLTDVYKAYGCASYTTSKGGGIGKYFLQYFYSYDSVNYRIFIYFDYSDKVCGIEIIAI